jgi:hypothetical protein
MATISGGERLAAKLRELAQHVTNPASVRVGFLEGATGSDGMSIPLRAALTEFGVPSRGQPPRPAFRNMVAAESKHWGADVAAALKVTGWDAKAAMKLMGEQISGELRKSIAAITSPALAPSTIARKGSSKPWIETGETLAAVAYEVK